MVRGARGDAVEELEDRGPDHWHHAAVTAVDLEVLEVEVARAHELGERAAARERRSRARAFRHEDRQLTDPVERIRLLIYERPRHRCDGTPTLGIARGEMPRAAAAHGVPREKSSRPIGAVLFRHDLERRDDLELAQRELAAALRRDCRALRGGRL